SSPWSLNHHLRSSARSVKLIRGRVELRPGGYAPFRNPWIRNAASSPTVEPSNAAYEEMDMHTAPDGSLESRRSRSAGMSVSRIQPSCKQSKVTPPTFLRYSRKSRGVRSWKSKPPLSIHSESDGDPSARCT